MTDEKSVGNGRKSILKSSSGMALATFLSRMLGLFRVRFEASVLGGGELASAWGLAFAAPNLLRRILGEGAISSALIPLIAETDQQEGKEKVKQQLALVFAFLGILLAVLVILVSAGSWLLGKYSAQWGIAFLATERIQLMFKLLPLLMPYGFFICLVGVAGAVLNYAKVFLRPALAALLLNVVLLLVFSWVLIFAVPEGTFLPVLSLSVPFAGVLQLILMLLLLWKTGYFPDFRNGTKAKGIIGKLFRLALPGMMGYGVLQISFLVDRMMAVSLGAQAVPALNYVERIVDIPIGIVAVSLGNVLMSMMSRSAAAGDTAEIRSTLEFSLRMVWFITLPLAVMVIFFHENMLQILCLGGKYTRSDLDAAHYVAVFYGIGIPFFCSLKVILPAFYARKKMVTVLVVSTCVTVLNIVLNSVLMHFLAQGGIALATVVSSLANNTVLLVLLKRDNMNCDSIVVAKSLLRSAAAALGIGFLCRWTYLHFLETWAIQHWMNCLAVLAVTGTVFMALYLGAVTVLRAPELQEVLAVFRRRKRKA